MGVCWDWFFSIFFHFAYRFLNGGVMFHKINQWFLALEEYLKKPIPFTRGKQITLIIWIAVVLLVEILLLEDRLFP